MATLTAGLFGKLPAHGDFVRRGWPDETVDALDRWLSAAMAARRDAPGFDDWMRAAPLWRGYVPAGLLCDVALHVGVAASVDRAGRLFPIAAGVAGPAAAAWAHARDAGGTVDAAIYSALAGHLDADGLVATIAVPAAGGGGEDAPASSCWWQAADGAPLVASAVVDAPLLIRLMSEGPR